MEETTFTVSLPSLAEGDRTSASPAPTLAFDPVALEYRHDGWTPERQRAFIEELADCGIVREAAARVGMTEQSASRLRRRDEAASFRIAWDAAIRMGGERLRSVAFDRAVNGTLRRHYYHGAVVDEERVYDNRLLIYLLGRLPSPGLPPPWNGDRFLALADHGLPMPESFDKPVWREAERGWRTSFPPPDGFAGDEHGCFGDPDYDRALTPEEQAAADARIARKREQAARARNLYFEHMG
ncbi:hypothetical protein [Sphingosinicella rhizophila]|uniref:Uncharacterized protein n=1 Tax=Sphingosinicella rhizophila TaxID=3050082 RepID=A0ABU3QA32_9SPHN|nr:hypothetical protein [Sphingosinicella sp. GR2756]MDT9600266.1 hypothetical protein [Sphingosinicella sp. GR2756]